jgi:lysophospholipase L1-like esterase
MRSCFFAMMVELTISIIGTFSFRLPTSINNRQTSLKMMSSISSQPNPIRILCYGDSLTAGTSPPIDQLHPYGPHLEKELNRLYALQSNAPSTVVRWRGLPGWTASVMTEYLDDSTAGLRSAVNSIRDPPLSLVIILAGSNDIGMLTSSMSSTEVNGEDAVAPILSLHKACLECDQDSDSIGLRTLAVGIPGSGWQQMNPMAKKLWEEMNDSLVKFASSSVSNYGGRVSYVKFPFEYVKGDSKWCSDGLHLSPEGYELLGVQLASSVKKLLDAR